MKKVLLILPIILAGCATKPFEVFQVLDDGVLASECGTGHQSYCGGHIVFIPKEELTRYELIYEGLMVAAPTGKTPKKVNVKEYKAVGTGETKTVPMVRFE